LVVLSALMTIGVYGLVAGIVKLDDAGQNLVRRGEQDHSRLYAALGGGIVRAAPWLMKTLSVAGTLAMFLVGGGIVTHAVPGLHDAVHGVAEELGALGALLPTLLDFVAGIVTGGLAVAAWSAVKRVRGKGIH
jgi:predicted DNA repair protein MutK